MLGRAIGVLLGLCTCASAACSEAERYAEDPDGHYRFAVAGEPAREGDAQRTLWRIAETGVVVTAQRIPKSDTLVRERALRDVVDAIGVRYAQGEVPGSMDKRECLIAGRDAYCLNGWIDRDDAGGAAQRYFRQGIVVEIGDAFVLLEVTGPRAARSAVVAQGELLRRTFVSIGNGD